MNVNIFEAQTPNIIIFKTLIDLISQISSVDYIEESTTKNVKRIFLKITKNSMEFFSEQKKVVVCNAIFTTDNFTTFEFKDEEPLCIGISLNILKNSFKNINRNDILNIAIPKKENLNFPDTIFFTVNNIKGFNIKFTIMQNMINNNYSSFTKIIEMPSKRLNNLCKEIGGTKKDVLVKSTDNNIRFSSELFDIATIWVEFPFYQHTDINVNTVMKSEYFRITSKISTVSNVVDFSLNDNGDILMSVMIVNSKNCNIGNIEIMLNRTFDV
nr:MAG: hypothetical protein DiTV3a_F16ORF1 [Diabrotica toursvirus 3a]